MIVPDNGYEMECTPLGVKLTVWSVDGRSIPITLDHKKAREFGFLMLANVETCEKLFDAQLEDPDLPSRCP